MTRRAVVATVVASSLALVWGCSTTEVRLGVQPAEQPSFTAADASVAEAEAGLIAYCPATTCLAPFTTCPGSRFMCDVNLMSDPENCGSCGFKCPSSQYSSFGEATFTCVAGTCVMQCKKYPRWTLDCNGLLDDDCEVTLGTNDNCTACGDKCSDPAKPCIFNQQNGTGKCGCDEGRLYCSTDCIDPSSADEHCGGCGNSCDREGGGRQSRPNMYYGCSDGTCDHLKCESGYTDCDQDLANGCETSLVSPTSCGGCGIVCDANQVCKVDSQGVPRCMCPPGQTLCGDGCVDLRSDHTNCGSCGVQCSQAAGWTTGVAVCNYGACAFQCAQGRADCNGEEKDGCEINLNSDPRNCGKCGHTCEPAQPCVAGSCAVVPCSEGVEAR